VLVVLAFTTIGAARENKVFLDFKNIIDHVNSVQNNWKAGHNHYFDGMDLEQIKNLMGTLETPDHLKLPLLDIEPMVNIPDEFSSAEHWPNCESIKEVRDQSTCGSCWAFGAVEAISDRICIVSGQKLQVRISAEDLLTCCTSCGSGCNGGYTASAFSYWKNTGIVTGWLYNTSNWCMPYTFKECDHHVVGKHEPCGNTQPTPKCKTTCATGYSG
jgi:cathepsin B